MMYLVWNYVVFFGEGSLGLVGFGYYFTFSVGSCSLYYFEILIFWFLPMIFDGLKGTVWDCVFYFLYTLSGYPFLSSLTMYSRFLASIMVILPEMLEFLRQYNLIFIGSISLFLFSIRVATFNGEIHEFISEIPSNTPTRYMFVRLSILMIKVFSEERIMKRL